MRRDRNLMARYPDEAAHQRAREAALDTVRLAIRASALRLKRSRIERKPLLDEAEFYVGKPLPALLEAQIDANDAAVEAQRSAMLTQEAELVRINRLYDAELERLRQLWAGAPPGSLGPVASAPADPRPRPEAGGFEAPRAERVAGSAAEPAAQQFVDLRRVGLALAGLHDLADQRVEGLVLAGAELLDRLRRWRRAPRRRWPRVRRCRSSGAGPWPR